MTSSAARAGLVAVVAVAAAALFGATSAQASMPTPTAYRAHLNSVCRSYMPRIRRLTAAAARAQKQHDTYAFGINLGGLLAIGVEQDAVIRNTPVPLALRATMKPILPKLAEIDTHARRAITLAEQRNTAWVTELQVLGRLVPHANALLDGAGLRDCGSGQG